MMRGLQAWQIGRASTINCVIGRSELCSHYNITGSNTQSLFTSLTLIALAGSMPTPSTSPINSWVLPNSPLFKGCVGYKSRSCFYSPAGIAIGKISMRPNIYHICCARTKILSSLPFKLLKADVIATAQKVMSIREKRNTDHKNIIPWIPIFCEWNNTL